MRRYLIVGMAALMVVALSAPAAVADRAEPEQRCYGIQGHGDTGFVFDETDPHFAGEATMRVGGEWQTVDVVVRSDGTRSQHTLAFDQGTVSTDELVVLKPTDTDGVMQLLSRPTVVDGGTGKLHLLPGSTLIFVGPNPVEASWDIRGEICFEGGDR